MAMGPRMRTFWLTVHILASVGWMGAVAAYLVFDLTTMASGDVSTLRAAYFAMDSITRLVLIPLALAAWSTGLVMSLGTKWGLFRHYWTLASLILTTGAVVVLLVETLTIRGLAAVAADPATSPETLRALPNTLVHSIGGLIVLLAVLVLNMYKPRGLTGYGVRKLGPGAAR